MKYFEKCIFFIFSFLLLIFSSCSFLDSDEEKSSSGSVLNSSKILSGKVLAGGEVSSKSQNSARTILPDFPSSDLTYSVYASSDGGTTKSFVASVSSDGSFSLIISTDGTYVVYAEISSSSKVVYKGNSDSLTVSDGTISKNGNATTEIGIITANPVQSENGGGNAAVEVDVSGATEIQSVKAQWQKSDSSSAATFTKVVSSDSDRTFTLYLSDSSNSASSISSGTYALSLFFYSDSSSSIEVYRISETVHIYDNLTTSVCSGNAPYFSDNTIKLTSDIISGTAYARGTGATTLPENSNGANGTYYAPYSSISDALSKVLASGSDTMTIYLDGTCTLSSALSLSSAGKTLNINGLNDDADNSVLTGSSKNGIEISAGKVNLKNITVSGFSSKGVLLTYGTLTMESCVVSGNGSASIGIYGGGIYCGGGTLTLKNCKIKGNKAGYGGGIYNMSTSIEVTGCEISENTSTSVTGGGIYNTAKTGTVKFTDCTISKNGGSGATGGGVYNTGILTLSNCAISENTASSVGDGGGIYNSGTLTISGGTISGNSAGNGAGIYISSGGTAEISDGTLSGNTASKNGGGVYNAGTLTISSEDVKQNTATSSGGGIYNEGDLTLRCAVTNNSAETGGGIRTTEDISFSYSGATVSENYKTSDSTKANNVVISSGKVFKLAYTLQSGSKIGITLENALSSGESQVLTSGWKTYNSSTDASTIFSSDDDAYAISTNSEGEVIVTTATTLYETVYLDPTNGDNTNAGSSYDAPVKTMEKAVSLLDTSATNPTIYVMNSISVSDDESSASYWTFALSDSAPKVMLKRYDGTDGGSSFTGSILTVAAGGTVKATGIIFDGNSSVSGTEPLVNVEGGGTLTLTSCYVQNNVCSSDESVDGGGIYNEGTVTLSDSTVRGNKGTSGGGVYNSDTFIMSGSSVIGDSTATKTADSSSYSNHGVQGGGIYNSGTLYIGYTEADETKTDSSFSGGIYYNYGMSGGGIYNEGDLYFYGGKSGSIMYNYSSSNGKGVFNSGTFTMNGSATVDSSNDVYLSSGDITIGSALTGTAPVATITPSSYAAGTKVLSGDSNLLSANYTKFALSDTSTYIIASDGTLQYQQSGSLTVKISDTISLSLSSSSLSTAGATTLTLTAKVDETQVTATTSNTTVALYNGGVKYADSSVTTSVSADNTITVSGAVAPGNYQLLVTFTYDGKDYQTTFDLTAADED